VTNNVQANVFQPEKKRRHREGYADSDYTLFKQIGVAEFINAPDPVAVLGAVNRMAFTTEEEKSYVRQTFINTFVLINALTGQLGFASSYHFGRQGQLGRPQSVRERRL
jgi:Domain of unknown function (DUF3381)